MPKIINRGSQTIRGVTPSHAWGVILAALLISLIPTGTVMANPVDPFSELDSVLLNFSLGKILLAMPLAILVEFITLVCIRGAMPELLPFPLKKVFLTVAGINLLTVPGAWFLLWLLQVASTESSAFLVLTIECLVVLVEAVIYRWVFSLSMKDAFWLSFFSNLASFIAGLILFGVSKPQHSLFDISGWD
jgi:hypothetical protein